ncbi:MAG TPA: hypothetical protein VNE40_02640 [Candidatus Dormibacteraeota bacterium]|nr:hypothetical protein [Candidatus Dormibacteraeota bacterium]
MSWKKTLQSTILILLISCSMTTVAFAGALSSSTNYQVDEVFFGSGGALNACSTNYCAKQSAGELGVGNIKSPNYQAQAGFNTDRTPFLQFIVNGTSTDLGVLTTSSAATTRATFSVKDYLSSGYTVITASNPPQNDSYTMHALTTPTASSPGTEQFGMNLVANTSPTTFGANPSQSPDSSFGFGVAASGYNTANLFKYVKGDVIASSAKSSGETDYTISYIYNVSSLTPGGTYTFNDVLVATAGY